MMTLPRNPNATQTMSKHPPGCRFENISKTLRRSYEEYRQSGPSKLIFFYQKIVLCHIIHFQECDLSPNQAILLVFFNHFVIGIFFSYISMPQACWLPLTKYFLTKLPMDHLSVRLKLFFRCPVSLQRFFWTVFGRCSGATLLHNFQ